MPERLRQPRHSRVSTCARALAGAIVRVALLCALALLGGGCPAVLDLESGPTPEGSEQDPPEPETEDDPELSVVDAAIMGVNPISPRVEGAVPCRQAPAPVPEDAGRPDTAADPGQVRGASAPTGPELALRAVVAAGYVLPCGREHTHVVLLPDGYELSALGHTGLCPPFDTMLYRLRVSKFGQITVLDAVTFNPAQLGCAGAPQLTQEPTAPPLA